MKTMVLGVTAALVSCGLAVAGGGGDGEKKGEQPKKSEGGTENAASMERLAGQDGQMAPDVSVTGAPGSGFTITVGDDFAVTIVNRLQVLWSFEHLEFGPDTNTFDIRRARTTLKGFVWDKNLTYELQMDWTRTSPLLDGWVNWAFLSTGESEDNNISLRLGQMKPHHGFEYQISSSSLEHIERSLASNVFSGHRVIGAYLEGEHFDGGLFNWYAGVINGDPAGASNTVEAATGSTNPDNELSYVFSAAIDPFGDMDRYSEGDLDHEREVRGTIGASVLVGNNRTAGATPNVDVDTTSVNLYTGWKVAGIHALGEFFFRSDDPENSGVDQDATGWNVQTSYTFPPANEADTQYSLALRYSQVSFDDTPVVLTGTPLGTTKGDVSELGVTLDMYYHAHKLKSQIGYMHQWVDPDGGGQIDNDVIAALFQVVF